MRNHLNLVVLWKFLYSPSIVIKILHRFSVLGSYLWFLRVCSTSYFCSSFVHSLSAFRDSPWTCALYKDIKWINLYCSKCSLLVRPVPFAVDAFFFSTVCFCFCFCLFIDQVFILVWVYFWVLILFHWLIFWFLYQYHVFFKHYFSTAWG